MTEQRYGPNTAEVERLLAVLRTATPEDQRACNRALLFVPDDVWYPAVKRAGDANCALEQPRHSEWLALCDVLGPEFTVPAGVWAAWGLILRDVIDPDDFEVLVNPVVQVFGRCWEEEG